jgi:hypothetical protein
MSDKPQKAFNVQFHILQGRNLLIQRNNTYEIEETGVRIWELCDGAHSIEEIARVLASEYDVSFEIALADSQQFIQELSAKGLLL